MPHAGPDKGMLQNSKKRTGSHALRLLGADTLSGQSVNTAAPQRGRKMKRDEQLRPSTQVLDKKGLFEAATTLPPVYSPPLAKMFSLFTGQQNADSKKRKPSVTCNGQNCWVSHYW